jgi:hypothetical protein
MSVVAQAIQVVRPVGSKGVHRFPVDFRGLDPIEVAKIEQEIAKLPPASQARLMYLR